MDKYKIKINPRAIRELDHIFEYTASEKLAYEKAKGQVNRIKETIFRIDEPHNTVFVVTIQYQKHNR